MNPSNLKYHSQHTCPASGFAYLRYDPPGYNEKTPRVIFLHGSGQRGEILSEVARWGLPRLIEEGQTFPFVTLSPQGSKAVEDWEYERLSLFVDQLRSESDAKIILTGFSLGAYGVWDFAVKRPEVLTAIVPLAGGGDPSKAAALVNLPCWAFHGKIDEAVPVEESIQMIEAIRIAGGDPKFTLYPDLGHGIAELPFQSKDLLEWLEELLLPA